MGNSYLIHAPFRSKVAEGVAHFSAIPEDAAARSPAMPDRGEPPARHIPSPDEVPKSADLISNKDELSGDLASKVINVSVALQQPWYSLVVGLPFDPGVMQRVI